MVVSFSESRSRESGWKDTAHGDPLGLGDFHISPDTHWLAYSVDTTGYRQYRLHFKDLRTQKVSADSLERVTSEAWGQDNKTIFYTTEDPITKRSDKFWRHTVGTSDSKLLYTEADELFDVSCGASRDQSRVLLHCHSKTSSEIHYRPADASESPLQILRPRQPDHEYSSASYQRRFVLRTNLLPPHFKVVVAPAQHLCLLVDDRATIGVERARREDEGVVRALVG